jgi:hypothetical protein
MKSIKAMHHEHFFISVIKVRKPAMVCYLSGKKAHKRQGLESCRSNSDKHHDRTSKLAKTSVPKVMMFVKSGAGGSRTRVQTYAR